MNVEFLGDALDHWKGSLFRSLRRGDLLLDLAVEPMFSDAGFWKASAVRAYARLLGVPAERIVRHRRGLGDRDAYFEEIHHSRDLFLDPDTGVAVGARCDRKHVAPGEVARLLMAERHRVVAVYQHSGREEWPSRIRRVVRRVARKVDRPLVWSSYQSAAAAMLFFAVGTRRPLAIQAHFARELGAQARHRLCGS